MKARCLHLCFANMCVTALLLGFVRVEIDTVKKPQECDNKGQRQLTTQCSSGKKQVTICSEAVCSLSQHAANARKQTEINGNLFPSKPPKTRPSKTTKKHITTCSEAICAPSQHTTTARKQTETNGNLFPSKPPKTRPTNATTNQTGTQRNATET